MATNSNRNTTYTPPEVTKMWPKAYYPQESRVSPGIVPVTDKLEDLLNYDSLKKPSMQETTKQEAVKFDDGKADWTLVPFESLEGMVKVLEFGAKKYSGWNWTDGGGFKWTRVLASCLRHLFAWSRGQDNDPESGLSHIYHAQCNLLFLAHYIGNKEKFNKDDRNVR